jgi:hypothetical protein
MIKQFYAKALKEYAEGKMPFMISQLMTLDLARSMNVLRN